MATRLPRSWYSRSAGTTPSSRAINACVIAGCCGVTSAPSDWGSRSPRSRNSIGTGLCADTSTTTDASTCSRFRTRRRQDNRVDGSRVIKTNLPVGVLPEQLSRSMKRNRTVAPRPRRPASERPTHGRWKKWSARKACATLEGVSEEVAAFTRQAPRDAPCTLPGGRPPSHIIQCEQNSRRLPQKYCARSIGC